MEIRRCRLPAELDALVHLWTGVFGAEEAALERVQLDGSEAADNLDFALAAWDGDRPVGAVHATIPRRTCDLAGLSGMCVVPERRGKGLARALFGAMMETLDALGIDAAFLGTDNPDAAGLYASFGFSFLPGSNVMARCPGGWRAFDARFHASIEPFFIADGSAQARIPLIPLVARRGVDAFLLDRNAGWFSTAHVTQRSCMGLYPKLAGLKDRGGGFLCAWDACGTLGAVATALPAQAGVRADFFALPAFEPAVGGIIRRLEGCFGDIWFEFSTEDRAKQEAVRRLGYREAESVSAEIGRFRIPCIRWRKKGA